MYLYEVTSATQLVNKFSAVYWTWSYSTVFRKTHH